jgi:hypothetical protein
MEVSITEFRRNMFALVDRALRGEVLLVRHKGRRLRIEPDVHPSTRFDRVTSLQVVHPSFESLDVPELKDEMQKAWEQDWDEL